MTSRDFVYWFQGYLEIEKPKVIDEEKIKIIQNHLNLVFKHEIDPSMGDEKVQKELNNIHSGLPPHPSSINNDKTLLRC